MSEMIIFVYKEQYYAIEANMVEEIMEPSFVTAAPRVSEIVSGLINVHGKIVILFDFAKIVNKYSVKKQENDSSNNLDISLNDLKHSKDNVLLIKSEKFLYGLKVGDIIGKIAIDGLGFNDIEEKSNLCEKQFLYNDKIVFAVNLTDISNYIEDEKSKRKKDYLIFGKLLSDAKKNNNQDHKKEEVSYLLAKMNDRVFAIDVKYIQELIFLGEITEIPFLSSKVLGITNLRNNPLIVLSLPQIIYDESFSNNYQYGIVISTPKGPVIFATHDLFRIEVFSIKDYHPIKDQKHEINGWLKGKDSKFFPTIDVNIILKSNFFKDIEGYIHNLNSKEVFYMDHNSKRFLVSKINDEYCAIPLDEIKIVVDDINIQSLPIVEDAVEVKNVVLGVAQVLGEIIFVLDIFSILNKQKEKYKNYVIINAGSKTIALAIQNIDMVVGIPDSKIESFDVSDGVISSIAKIDNKLISILDVKKMLHFLPISGEVI